MTAGKIVAGISFSVLMLIGAVFLLEVMRGDLDPRLARLFGKSRKERDQPLSKDTSRRTIMLRKSLLAITFLASFAAAGAASAAPPETTVLGDVRIDVSVEDVETEAAFLGDAETDIGSILEGTLVAGRARITVDAEDVKTEAAFLGDACTSIGSIGGCKP